MTRSLLGLDFPDYGPRETFRLFEFETGDGLPDEAQVVFSDSTTNVLWPITAVRGRWSLQISDDDPTDVEALLQQRAPWFSTPRRQEIWNTEVTFEHRLVEHFGRGPVWLAGDAAHVGCPIGVQNMNVSLREVADLADRLAGGEGTDVERSLHNYDTERRSEWRRLLGVDGRLEVRSEAPDWARELAARLPPCLPASGRDLNDLLGQVGLHLRDGPATE
jgi:2-polyprenyl-6-methoxyphenol hydroxylase-like FAD-dependent oxidoreductase